MSKLVFTRGVWPCVSHVGQKKLCQLDVCLVIWGNCVIDLKLSYAIPISLYSFTIDCYSEDRGN